MESLVPVSKEKKRCVDQLLQQIEGETLFCYSGAFTEDFGVNLASEIETELKASEHLKKLRKRFFLVFIELMQNIRKHSTEGLQGRNKAVVVITRLEDGIHIYTQNRAAHSDLKDVLGRLDQLVTLDKTGVQELYLETLSNGQRTKHGGSGLGLIEITRKSGNPIAYKVEKDTNETSILCLTVKIS